MIWSNKVNDLYNNSFMNKGLDFYKEYFLNNFAKTYVKSIPGALLSGNEIMLYCKSYYLLLVDNEEVEDFIEIHLKG